MILGLAAGRWLRAAAPKIPFKKMFVAAAICLAAGLLLHFAGICPIVKRIWTPAWTLFSGGVCFLFVSAFSFVIDVKGYRKWAFPLIVIGMNSIAAYLIADMVGSYIHRSFQIHIGPNFFRFAGDGWAPRLFNACRAISVACRCSQNTSASCASASASGSMKITR